MERETEKSANEGLNKEPGIEEEEEDEEEEEEEEEASNECGKTKCRGGNEN